jgi:plasmid stabilization system protein ParE
MIPSVSREAELELTDAATYYAKEGSLELGLAFIDEFEQALDLLCQQPQLGALWRARRRLPLRRFPYSLIYYVSGDSLRVIEI